MVLHWMLFLSILLWLICSILLLVMQSRTDTGIVKFCLIVVSAVICYELLTWHILTPPPIFLFDSLPMHMVLNYYKQVMIQHHSRGANDVN